MPLIRIKYKNYPKLIEVMENRHLMYNQTLSYISQREKEGNLFVIRPKPKTELRKNEK